MSLLAGDDKHASDFLARLDDDLFPGQPDKDYVDTVTWCPQWSSGTRDELVAHTALARVGTSADDASR